MYIVKNMLLSGVGETGIPVGSPGWFSWLAEQVPTSFSLRSDYGSCTFRYERRGEQYFWYAYSRQQGKLRKLYVGLSNDLTQEHLSAVVEKLTGHALLLRVDEADDVPQKEKESGLHLYLLGEFRIEYDGQVLSLGSAKAQALLAYLALEDTMPTRDALLGLLWPESAQEAARKNLQNTLWTIRSLLPEKVELIEILPNGRIKLHEGVRVDVQEFLHLSSQIRGESIEDTADILALYRGPLLDGLVLSEAPAFERWLLNERDRLAQSCLHLLTLRIEAYRSNGAWSEVLETGKQALALDALQEPMHRFVMLAYARLGRRTEALRHYEQLQTLFEDELGVAPLPETEALRTAIAQGSIAPIASSRTRLRMVEETGSALPFVGRKRELAVLDKILQQTLQQQRAHVAVLPGELGIGKSRLWYEWSSQLDSQLTVLECRCLESTRAIPFAPLSRLFASFLAHNKKLRLAATWLAELARLVPELRERYPDLPPTLALPPAEERGRLFEACLHTLQALGKPPFVLFVDDLHWADSATLDWLAYLIDQSSTVPLLLVLAYRPAEVSGGFKQLVAGWERRHLVAQVALTQLAQDETRMLVSAAQEALPDEAVEYLYRQSAGNPYYLMELLQAGPERVPTSLATLVQARLERLQPIARQVVQAAAILDPDISMAVLRQSSGRNEDETLDALDGLVENAFLQEASAPTDHELAELTYTFAHPFVGSVIRESLSGARRAAIHRRAADALVGLYGEHLSPLAGRLCVHYREAGQRRLAAQYAELAGQYALSVASPREAIAFYEQALALGASGSRHFGLALAQIRDRQIDAARAALEQALREYAAANDEQGVTQAVAYYFETFTLVGQYVEAIAWLERPEIQVYARMIPASIAAVLLNIVEAMKYRYVTPSLSRAEQAAARSVQLITSISDRGLALRVHLTLAGALAEQGKWAEAIISYRNMAQVAHEMGDVFQEVLARNNVAYHSILLHDLKTARREIEQALELAQTYALYMTRFYLYSTYGELFLAQQHWEQAELWFKRGLVEVRKRDDTQAQVAELYANLGRAAQGRGDVAEAARLLERARKRVAQAQVPFQQTQIDLWLAELYSTSGQIERAQEALARAEERFKESEWLELQRRATDIRAHLP